MIWSTLTLMAFAAVVIWGIYRAPQIGDRVGDLYIQEVTDEIGVPNAVSAIYINYRFYDTLLELLVFSAAVFGVSFFSKLESRQKLAGSRVIESQVVKASASLLFPVVALFGFYLATSAHLGPGGGFVGGAIGGTSILLISMSIGAETVGKRFHEDFMKKIEYLMILVIILIGFSTFLLHFNMIPAGWSVSYMTLINLIIALKVFIGTWAILHFFIQHRGEI